jgi:6-phosphogluconolactonase
MRQDLSRRDFLALSGAALASSSAASAFQSPKNFQSAKKLFAYASSWTKGPFGVGGGGGISVFTVNMSDGSLTPVSRTGPEFDDLNGGCICISPNGRFLYCTNEIKHLNNKVGAGGGVLSFAINQENGSLTHLNTQPSMGVNATWVGIDATGTRVVVANHGDADPVIRVVKKNGVPEIENFFDDGTVSLFAVKPDGTLEPASDVAVFERTHGVDMRTQGSAHAHSANFDPSNRFVLACDTGGDYIYIYRVEPQSRAFTNTKAFKTRPGIAPRHSAFHRRLPYVFIIHERESSLASYRFESRTGDVSLIQTVPTVPADFTGRNAPADIRVHPNGKFVYGGNRGHDSIAGFRIDEATGKVTAMEIVPAGGSNCREFNFEPSGKYMFVANMESNNIVTFAVDPDTGKMTPTGAKIGAPKPASLQFVAL